MNLLSRTLSSLAALAAIGLVAASHSSAAILLDDTFSDADRAATVGLPTDSSVWVSHPAGVTMNVGSLLFDQQASSGSQKLWTHFAADGSEVELAVGDSLIATIVFTPRGLYDNSGRSFRMGLFNDPTDAQVASDINSDGGGGAWTDSTGYAAQIALTDGTTASSNINLGKRTDLANGSLLGSSGAYTATSGGASIVNTSGTQYTATMTLHRTAVDMLDATFALSDAGGEISSYTITDDPNGSGAYGTDPIYTTYEQLFFRFSNNTQTADYIDFNRITIEHVAVPEPSSIALLGLFGGLLAAARLRRA